MQGFIKSGYPLTFSTLASIIEKGNTEDTAMNTDINNRVAFFEMCDCGLHGHITFPDGSLSQEFFSQEEAVEVIGVSLREGHLKEDEKRFLSSEVGKLEFLSDRIFSSLDKALHILIETGHPQEAINKIVSILHGIADDLYEKYCEHQERAWELGPIETRHTIH